MPSCPEKRCAPLSKLDMSRAANSGAPQHSSLHPRLPPSLGPLCCVCICACIPPLSRLGAVVGTPPARAVSLRHLHRPCQPSSSKPCLSGFVRSCSACPAARTGCHHGRVVGVVSLGGDGRAFRCRSRCVVTETRR